MDTLLIVVTAIALAMAIAMAGLVVKLLRDERLRSAARVAALTAAVEGESDSHVPRATINVPRADVPRAAVDVPRADVPRATSNVPRADVPRATSNVQSRPTDLSIDPREPAWDMQDLDVRPSPVAREHVARGTSHVARDASLFATPAPSSPWGARLAVAAALAAIVGFGGYALLTRPSASTGESQPLAQAAPLELLSLSHNQQPQSLTVTGLVQNPRTGIQMSRVVATAFVFAADNTFLGSGRAALDYATLSPGDESPFVITIPVSAGVARYRVGFRDESGRVIAHVDRRTNSTMAQMTR